MPFWTLNPNWYFVSGLFTTTWTVGGHDTTFITTLVPGREFFGENQNSTCKDFYNKIQEKDNL